MLRPLALVSLLVTIAAGGCAGEAAPPSDDAPELAPPDGFGLGLAPQGTSLNGTSLNGTSLNGTSLNGTSLNGTSLNGTSLNGTSLNGTSLNGVSLAATNFTGKRPDGSAVTGAGFVGTEWTGTLSNGSTLKLRIDGRAALAAPNADVFAYGVSYQTASGWAPLCGVDAAGLPVLAIPLAGTWNYKQGVPGGGGFTPSATSFTFACRATAIAKCVELGYKPWKAVGATPVTLQNHLNACTRMLRADYCGDGKSWTVDGTQINLYDNVGVQSDTQSWTVEAEWTAAGARYVSPFTDKRYRKAGWLIPPCFLGRLSSSAGDPSHFSTGTLLVDEYR